MGATVQVLRELGEGAAAMGVRVHLDGARLWNAHVATGVPLAGYGACADTVSVCLSKGLGAPVGSVLVSSAERIAAARVWRKRYGGGMRQVGMLAAAGRYALAHHVERLADDHRRARQLAAAVAQARPGAVDPTAVQTNIVVIALSGTSPSASKRGRSSAKRSSSSLGRKTSTCGNVRARIASQFTCPHGPCGSGGSKSSVVVAPVALARWNISLSSWPPSAYMRRIRDG